MCGQHVNRTLNTATETTASCGQGYLVSSNQYRNAWLNRLNDAFESIEKIAPNGHRWFEIAWEAINCIQWGDSALTSRGIRDQFLLPIWCPRKNRKENGNFPIISFSDRLWRVSKFAPHSTWRDLLPNILVWRCKKLQHSGDGGCADNHEDDHSFYRIWSEIQQLGISDWLLNESCWIEPGREFMALQYRANEMNLHTHTQVATMAQPLQPDNNLQYIFTVMQIIFSSKSPVVGMILHGRPRELVDDKGTIMSWMCICSWTLAILIIRLKKICIQKHLRHHRCGTP